MTLSRLTQLMMHKRAGGCLSSERAGGCLSFERGFHLSTLISSERAGGCLSSERKRGSVPMKMWREVEKEASEQSLWIERKKFYVSRFPGRSIRVVEMLKFRSYSVEFKSYEVSWFIDALREAGQVTFGAPFSKNATFGHRSMFLSIESNRAGVFIKLVCSFGGRYRRLLLIPAGENGEGWLNLANLLAIISSGGDHGVKKPVVPFSNHRSGVNRKESLKEKIEVAEEWKEGFLPVFLKHGLELCVGDPFSSEEASRFFAWKRMQSEFGCGLLVVEKTLRSGSPSNLTLACTDVFSGGVGCAGEDEEKEPRFLQAIDVDGVSICGNDSDAPVNYPCGVLGGGPIPSVVLAQVSNEVLSQLVLPVISCGGAHIGLGDYLGLETVSNQSLESPSSLSAEILSIASPREGNTDRNLMARHEDITIIDDEEALSFDSPDVDHSDYCVRSPISENSGRSDRTGEEIREEDGVSTPKELSSEPAQDQKFFNMAEEMCQMGFIKRSDRALFQALAIEHFGGYQWR